MAQFWLDDFIGIKYYAMNKIKAISHYMITTMTMTLVMIMTMVLTFSIFKTFVLVMVLTGMMVMMMMNILMTIMMVILILWGPYNNNMNIVGQLVRYYLQKN